MVLKWEVFNRGNWDQNSQSYVSNGAPMFYSSLFSPEVLFGKKTLDIKIKNDTGESTIETMTYPELKAKYSTKEGDKLKTLFKLQCTIFTKIGDELVRVRFKGASRSAIFDYLKSFKGQDSISAHNTNFSAVCVTEVANPFNKSVLKVDDNKLFEVDWNKVVEMQAGVNKIFEQHQYVEEETNEPESEIEVGKVVFD